MARIGWLSILLAVCAVLLPIKAQAAGYDIGRAMQDCRNSGSWNALNSARKCVDIGPQPGSKTECLVGLLATNGPGYLGLWTYTCAKKCDSRADYNGPYPNGQFKPTSGSLSCDLGCEVMWTHNADGTVNGSTALNKPCTGEDYDNDDKCNAAVPGGGYHYNAQVDVCEPSEPKCPGGTPPNSLGQCAPEPCPSGMLMQGDGTCKKKQNECPAGLVRSPDGRCLPGDGQCGQGEARGADGTCKRDKDGDGKPDGEGGGEDGEGGEGGPGGEGGTGKNDFFAGGDGCNAPPSCSGSPILCGQARIQWRIDCNTRKNRNVAGGACNTPPVCTGEKCDALEYSQLLMQWRSTCALEKMASKSGEGNGAQPEWTKVGGMSTDPGAGASPNDTKVLTTKQISVGDLDQSGIGGGGSCMGFASGSSSGAASGFLDVMASPPSYFCDYIGAIKALIILTASVVACFILSRGGA